ncbi:OLC1v1028658C1 [Oldenlandia corymbosa var. corymbosa]|uniref:OLC1v1028658C1 n=1 Tax=Oldenlandia corymbosa var. corymbosa TaxID=529605 RepID=A0AAV1CCQ2_OLDCO|nr:OLC1v1028658C1 [Oldenlandia corymbosa var. corymbosa]
MFHWVLVFLSLCCSQGAAHSSSPSSAQTEAAALLTWKSNLLNPSNPLLSSWHLHQPITNGSRTRSPCNWYGVSCINGSVHTLNLTESNISGTLHGFPFLSLPNLEYLDFSMNELSGSIPPQLDESIFCGESFDRIPAGGDTNIDIINRRLPIQSNPDNQGTGGSYDTRYKAGGSYDRFSELWGLYHGLKLAWNNGEKQIMAEMDSRAAVHIVEANCLPDCLAGLKKPSFWGVRRLQKPPLEVQPWL